MLIYELATFINPFGRGNEVEENIKNAFYKPLPDHVSVELKELIEKCL